MIWFTHQVQQENLVSPLNILNSMALDLSFSLARSLLGIENEESGVKIDFTTIHGSEYRTDHHETLSSLEPNRHDQDSEETRQAKWIDVSRPFHP
jgi:hypothetical protein